MDDHQFKEDNGSAGELSTVCLQFFSNVYIWLELGDLTFYGM